MKRYDVFLSYAHSDRAVVEHLARELREREITAFLDRWELIPGEPWQAAMEAALESSKAVLVFLGPSGLGPWAQNELAYAINERIRDAEFRVIPVLGPGADPKEIPALLRNLTFVDLRDFSPDALSRIEGAIKGEAPGRPRRQQGGASPKVFLCHAKEDSRRVEDLYYALLDEGLDPWFDKKKLVVGVRWREEIFRAIEQTDFFAVCISSGSLKKRGFIQNELRTAVQEYQRRPQDIAYLLPLRFEDCEIPAIRLDGNTVLPDLQWQDVFESDQGAITQLAKGIWAQWNR